MKRLSGLFWVVVVLLAGSTNFAVKHMVQSLDDELTNARRKTIAEQKQIHDLTAEWTFLNQPELLSDLNRRYIGLIPVSPKQIQRNIDDIPMRPAPPPAAEGAIEPEPAPIAATAGTPTPTPLPAPAPTPIVPVAAANVTRIAPPPPEAPPAPAPSLDGLFAQVAGEH